MAAVPAGSPASLAHRQQGAGRVARCAVITLSDSRRPEEDASGCYLREAIAAAGHDLVAYRLVRDEPEELLAAIDAVAAAGAELVVCTGGTGIAPRDRTVETLQAVWDRRLPGFGELFRQLSYADIGPAAMLSRAEAGLRGKLPIFALPGSPSAVALAWDKLIAPEIGHLLGLLG